MNRIYYIGGSPCCGKSTIARKLAEEYQLIYFEADEYLEACVRKGKAQGKPYCTNQVDVMGSDKWMRDPRLQAEEELLLYQEIFPYMRAELEKKLESGSIIAEGAVFLPDLVWNELGSDTPYVCMVPSPEFQVGMYRKRAWVWQVLEDCDNAEHAFGNWMERDILFAKEAARRASEMGFSVILVDGSRGTEELYQEVKDLLALSV